MACDYNPKKKEEAYFCFYKLFDTIKNGNPGYGKFNDFSFHDEWKNLLIDAEKYGSSYNFYNILIIGGFQRESLDYKTKTASYSAKISFVENIRKAATISVIAAVYIKTTTASTP